jgi:hypothetical protein
MHNPSYVAGHMHWLERNGVERRIRAKTCVEGCLDTRELGIINNFYYKSASIAQPPQGRKNRRFLVSGSTQQKSHSHFCTQMFILLPHKEQNSVILEHVFLLFWPEHRNLQTDIFGKWIVWNTHFCTIYLVDEESFYFNFAPLPA